MEEVPIPISLPQLCEVPAEAVVAACHIQGNSLTASAICHIVPNLLGKQKLKLEDVQSVGKPGASY